ncbi:hypothetical protein B6E66_03945 [Streptomyces maremycinicus]|nr:hypothetical protein B6E66_03945 [Streptomyces sp. B9173]
MRVTLHGEGVAVTAGGAVHMALYGGGGILAGGVLRRPALYGCGVEVTAGGAVGVVPGLPLPLQCLDDGGVAGRAL